MLEGLTATTVTISASDFNAAPVADAGPDRSVESTTSVTLDGSGSTDPNGDLLTFAWSQTGGPAVLIADADQAEAQFAAPASGSRLSFTLEVADGGGLSSSDSVDVTVGDPPAGTGGGGGGGAPGWLALLAAALLMPGFRRRSRSGTN
jgi:hypothetical protein